MNEKRPTAVTLIRAINVAALGAIALFLLLTLVFRNRIEHAEALSLRLALAGILFSLAAATASRLPGNMSALLRVPSIILLISFLFDSMAFLQHVFVAGWMDSAVLSAERLLTGMEATASLQRLVNPALTEWAMFCYVVYVPLLLITAAVSYRSRGMAGLYEYLFMLLCVNLICDLGFLLFPVAGPLTHMPEQFTVPLQGSVFTWCGEWMRANVHYPGGNLPSPHCAAGTIMMIAMYRSDRRWFLSTAPIFVTIYFSIAYCRYHYLLDGLAGILVACFVARFRAVLASGFASVSLKRCASHIPHPLSNHKQTHTLRRAMK